jgi:hypothetical protein
MAKTLAYWIPTVLFALAMTGSGLSSLLGVEEMATNFSRLGFPDWFMQWLGFAKVVGVVTLLAPGLLRFKEWAYAGFTITLVSAFRAHLAAGDPVGDTAAPLVMLTLGLVGYAFRPDSRKLSSK